MIKTLNKETLIKESETFCVMPWMHLHTVPDGYVKPCGVSSSKGIRCPSSVEETMNSDMMKTIRRDMLAGIKNDGCKICHDSEKISGNSVRLESIEEFSQHIQEDVIENTQEDGTLEKINLRYIDIRSSNICNFKCRYCGPIFSSKWQQEISKHGDAQGRNDTIIVKQSEGLQQDLLNYLSTVERVYFAGGEPLITEEHYKLLTKLGGFENSPVIFYSTNLSNLEFLNYDLKQLWKNINNVILLTASIDHIEERAEYMRHGTNWAQIEKNLDTVYEMQDNIITSLNIHVLVTNLNFLTLTDLLNYFKTRYPDANIQLNYCSQPEHLSPQCMPQDLIDEGIKRIKAIMHGYEDQGFVAELERIIHFVQTENTWERLKEEFLLENKHLDNIRNENFIQTFPELETMWDE